MRILVVDDDAAVRDSLARTLRFEGHEVVTADDGLQAIDAVRAREPDAMILDVSMPRLDGLEACRRLRADGELLPILMLTARDSVGDRVAGLDAGADDYLVKPFALQELQARLRALLRRSLISASPTPGSGETAPADAAGVSSSAPAGAGPEAGSSAATAAEEGVLAYADVRMDQRTREVRRGSRPVRLTRTEFAILEVFLQHPRQVLTRAALFEHVWGYDFGETSNSIHVYLGYLRRKLEAEGESRLLHTVRGVGFALREEPTVTVPSERPRWITRAGAGRWWGRRTLHARLSLLVTGAVAIAVLVLAGLAWTTVAEIQNHRMQAELTSDAAAIAAEPGQWLTATTALPDPASGLGDGDHHGPHQLGPRWQILDTTGKIISTAAENLPVTAAARRTATSGKGQAEEHLKIGYDSYVMLTVPATGGGAVQVGINQDPDDHALGAFGLWLLAGCAVGILGAALLGRTVARAGLVPVQRLTEAVEGVAVSMDLSRPVPVNGVDEIARLGTSVNTMLAAIDTARRAQRTLVEDAGHELRTPLTSIRTNIELLLEVERRPELAHRLPPEERAKLLADLDAQVGELATLTTELVELSREETTREDVEPVDLAEVAAAAISRVRIRAPGLPLTAELAPTLVQGRPGELERMILDVLDNAAKWSPAGSAVHTRLATGTDGRCLLTVTDAGPGIDEADRPHVFDRFYRATAARSMPGSGLGLAIVAQTATQHGGTVTTTAATPHGTVLTISLPTWSPPAEPRADRS